MSALNIGDLAFHDVLSESNLKPWWEKFRGYFFATGVFSSLSMVYLINSSSLSCLPLGKNETEEFSTAQAAAVNAYCFRHLPPLITHSGAIEFALSLVILLISSWWLIHPEVINLFSTFSHVCEIIGSLNMTSRDLLHAMTRPISQKASKENRKLEKAITMLSSYESSSVVEKLYVWRSLSLILALFASLTVSAWISFDIWRSTGEFRCEMAEKDDRIYLPDTNIYQCFSKDTHQKLLPFLVSFCFSQVGQMVSVFLGLLKLRKIVFVTLREIGRKKKEDGVVRNEAERNAKFASSFWENGNPSDDKFVKHFVSYMFLRTTPILLSQHIEEAVLEGDINFLYRHVQRSGSNIYGHLCGLLEEDFGKDLKKDLEKGLKKDLGKDLEKDLKKDLGKDLKKDLEKDPADGGQLDKIFIRVVDTIKPSVRECGFVLEALAKTKRWRLLSCALDNVEDPGNIVSLDWLERSVNLDEIASPPYRTPWDEKAGSLLFYALSRKFIGANLQFQAAKCLLENFRDGRKKYVHFRGKSMSLRNYLHNEYGPELTRKWFGFVDFPEHTQGARKSSSQAKIAELFTELQDVGNSPPQGCLLFTELQDVGNSPPQGYLDGLTNRVYRYKFSSWDEQSKAFAKLTFENGQWKVFVTLLNAFIVTEEDRPNVGRLACGVGEFKKENVEEIFPIALETQPLGFKQGYFVPTAARHIIACCTPDERKLCLKYIQDPQYELSEEDRTGLKKFISTCNGRGREREMNFDMHSSSSSGDSSCISEEKEVKISIPEILLFAKAMAENMSQEPFPQPSMPFSDGINEGDSTDSPTTSSSPQNPQPREARGGARPKLVVPGRSRTKTDSPRKKPEARRRLEQKQPSGGLPKQPMGESKNTEQKAEVLDHEKTETEEMKEYEECLLPKDDDSPPTENKEKKPKKGSKSSKMKTAGRVLEEIEMEDMKSEKQSLLQPKASSHRE